MKLQKIAICLWFMTFVMSRLATAQAAPGNVLQSFRDGASRRDVLSMLNGSTTLEMMPSSAIISSGALPDAPSMMAELPGLNAQESSPQANSAKNVNNNLNARPCMTVPISRSFWITNTLLFGSTVANVEMIARCRSTSCQSVPDAIRKRSALYGIGIPASLGISYISYRLRRGGTRWWIVPVAVFTAGNVVYAVHAAQWGH